jgi:hypothetical protein
MPELSKGLRNDLGRGALFLEADGFFHRDLVERVHAHLDVGEVDARPVRLDARLNVVIDHPLDGDEDFHGTSFLSNNLPRF